VKLRALVGNWDDEKVVFLGAVEQDIYEATCEDDLCSDTDRWAERKQQWIDAGPYGIGETREVEIDLHLPNGLFSTPQAPAQALPVSEGE